MEKFEGKVALVTGGTSGIGLEIVRLFIKNKMKVAIVSNESIDGLFVADMIKDSGGNAIFIEADIKKEFDIEHAVNTTIERFGKLDIAVNNAGIGTPPKKTADFNTNEWREIIDTNLTGTWLCMKNELKEMEKNNQGIIINISSIAGIRGAKGLAPYAASKHGIIGLTKTAAIEYADKNIKINAICPWIIETPMIQNMAIEELQQSALNNPMKRIGQPEEVANLVMWLCSENCTFITGQAINIDGGISSI